jgi:hypothetical protein
VPSRLEDRDKRQYRVVPENDRKGNFKGWWECWNIGMGDWEKVTLDQAKQTIRHVYQDEQSTLGYGRALREALGWWWYAKTHIFQESISAIERFGQGIIHAKIKGVRDAATGKPNTTLINEWKSVLEDLRARHVLVSDSEDQVETITPSGEGWQMSGEMRKELRTTIFTLVLGANLTTSADKGGSYALAEIQENSTESIVQCDRELLEETLTDDLLGCLWFKNWPNMVELGIANEMPRFQIVQEKRQDPLERSQVAANLTQMGVSLSLEDVLDQTGFRKPQEGEELITPQPQQPALPSDGFDSMFKDTTPLLNMADDGGDWEPYVGPRGGKGWKKGDKIVYGPKPGTREKSSDESETKDKPKAKDEPKVAPSKSGSGESKYPKEFNDPQYNPFLNPDSTSEEQRLYLQYINDKEAAKVENRTEGFPADDGPPDGIQPVSGATPEDLNAWAKGLSTEERQAMDSWTRSFEYQNLKAVQQGTQEPTEEQTKTLQQLSMALEKAPRLSGTFYRGMKLPEDSYRDLLKEGNNLEGSCHSSWTDDVDVAKGFSKATSGFVPVMVRGSLNSARSIDAVSAYSGVEREYLSMKGVSLNITKVSHAPDGTIIVDVKEAA